MSISLMAEAWKTDITASRKIVLLALCDNANDQGQCYPSIASIANRCSLTERAVYNCLRDLESDGYIRRDARDGRSTVYNITNPRTWFTPERRSPLNDVHPPLNDVHPPPERRSGAPEPRSPITITKPSMEPSLNRTNHTTQRKRVVDRIEQPEWVPADAWAAFLDHRLAIKSPMSPHAQRLAIRKLDELRQQGHAPVAVIEQSILHGWRGLFPLRVDDQRQMKQRQRRSIHDERAETIAALTGRTNEREIIDITPTVADGVD